MLRNLRPRKRRRSPKNQLQRSRFRQVLHPLYRLQTSLTEMRSPWRRRFISMCRRNPWKKSLLCLGSNRRNLNASRPRIKLQRRNSDLPSRLPVRRHRPRSRRIWGKTPLIRILFHLSCRVSYQTFTPLATTIPIGLHSQISSNPAATIHSTELTWIRVALQAWLPPTLRTTRPCTVLLASSTLCLTTT